MKETLVKETLVKEVGVKLEALEAVAKAIQTKEEEIEHFVQQGKQELAELSAEWHSQQNLLETAPDLTTAREIQAVKESIEKDINLQKTVNANKIRTAVSEIEDLAEDFRSAFYSVKKAYTALDLEIAQTINLRTLEETENFMRQISNRAGNVLGDFNRTLIRQGIIKQGEAFHKGLHLSQAPLNAYSSYEKVVSSLKTVVRDIN